jgi:mono/diheme cytochrome c family protein
MKARPLLLIVVLALAAVVAGCGGSGGTTASSTTTSTATTETTTGAEGGAAEAIFQANCSSCHKLQAAEATFGTYGPDLDELKPSEATVKSQVESGGGIMPAFGKSEILTAAEIEEVSRYVAEEAGK